MTLDTTLKERGTRYGKFKDNAEIAQALKNTISKYRKRPLAPDQHEALDMICAKVSRILTGDPDYADNWVDIAGYAQLVANRLMLATRENTIFKKSPIVGRNTLRITSIYVYELDSKRMQCEVSTEVVPDMAPADEVMHDDLVKVINEKICAEYPYEQIEKLIPVKSAPDMVAHEDPTSTAAMSLGQTIAESVRDLTGQQDDFADIPETWPQVEALFDKKFNQENPWENSEGDTKFVVVGNIVEFFRRIVHKFTDRAYMTGWQQGRIKGTEVTKKIIVAEVQRRIDNFDLRLLPALQDLLEFVERL